MKKVYLIVLFSLLGISKSFGQYEILCPTLKANFKIENSVNIPTITSNGDGTITLTHQEEYITNIFSNYLIYDLYKTFPSGSENLQKWYTIHFHSKDLINELDNNVPPEVFLMESSYENTSINLDLISFLDNKKFQLKKYCGVSDDFGEPCPEEDVPDNIDITVAFNYDAVNDLLLMESDGLTPCGNSFSIALSGGTEPNTLQTWTSTPETTTATEYDENPCHFIEMHLYSLLEIACNNGNYGNIIPTFDTENSSLFLFRDNMVFGYDTVTFFEANLSLQKNLLDNLKFYETEGNPYLQISSSENLNLTASIYSVSGVLIQNKSPLINNTIQINQLSSGIYFIHVKDSNSQSKMYKFLKK